ncbi:MAG: aminotransferase [Deltaproteobacteria bacterium]|nr:MAG: aminotransferase [Deltaproteobacteria bacterium]
MIRVSAPLIGNEELAAVEQAFGLGYFGHGSKVIEFEARLQEYIGAPHVVAVNSGSAALHLALEALGIGPDDEVIVPSLTFIACFQMITATGAMPVPCEVEADTLLMDLDDVARKITPRTRALMAVHYAGNPCNLDRLYDLAASVGIRVIEDAAHALGSTYKGRLIGSSGDLICFSFDSIKNITCGEGGAVVCHNNEVADIIRHKRLLGINRKMPIESGQQPRWYYRVLHQGFRYHMSNINAAIGLAQLRKLPAFIQRRQEIAKRYDQALANINVVNLLPIDYNTAAPHIYVIRVGDGQRDALMEFLRTQDIEASINYIPNHQHEYYQRLFREKGWSLPVTEQAFREILTLPLHCALSDTEVDKVIHSICTFFAA